jgi:excisionase family DNA binding protein
MTRLNQQPAGAGAAAYRSRRREVILDAQLPPGPRTRQQIRFAFTDIDPPRDDCRPARFRPAQRSRRLPGAARVAPRARAAVWAESVMVMDEVERLLTPGEVALLFRVDPKTVTRWAAAGSIGSIRTPGGHRRFRESEVLQLLATRTTDAVRSTG